MIQLPGKIFRHKPASFVRLCFNDCFNGFALTTMKGLLDEYHQTTAYAACRLCNGNFKIMDGSESILFGRYLLSCVVCQSELTIHLLFESSYRPICRNLKKTILKDLRRFWPMIFKSFLQNH